MNPGELNRRITIQAKQEIKDAEGIATEIWLPIAAVWAAVEPLRGREYFQAAAVNAEATIRVRIRYREGITADMRVKYGERTLEIISPPIDPEERHRDIHLMCKEVQNG